MTSQMNVNVGEADHLIYYDGGYGSLQKEREAKS
jgi:hypothetical protein